MSEKNGTVGSNLPKMIVREKTEANTTIPPLPKMSEEYKYGGAWMDPQWKKDINGTKKLFKNYPIQMGVLLGATVILAILLGLFSSCGGSTEETPSDGAGGCAGGSSVSDNAGTDDPSQNQDDENGGSELAAQLGDLYVSVVGYELFVDSYGDQDIMLVCNVTNTGDAAISAYDGLFYYLAQGETELRDDTSYFSDANASYNTPIQPGETLEVTVVFSGVDFEGQEISVVIITMDGDNDYLEFTCPVYEVE